jgi:type VI secretion system protein ImpJ
MFLRPQHFQQQQRYIEHFLEGRVGPLWSIGWGLSELRIDKDQLSAGKISIASASGIFPDGTPFSTPDHDPPPPALDVPENTHDLTLFLALPVRREGAAELAEENALTPARQRAQDVDARDISCTDGTPATIRVSGLNLRIVTGDDDRGDYSCIGFARIIESRSNKEIVLDENYIPSVTNCHAASQLKGYIGELARLLRHRCEAVSGRVAEAGRGGNAEISDFLLLQLVNRYIPLFAHFERIGNLQPEPFYRCLIEMAGEFATFTKPEKRPASFPEYRHGDLQATFDPVMRDLRLALSMVLDRSATQIPLQERKYGVRVASAFDRRLLVEATFCLIVRADMSVEELRRVFPTQVKIGPVEKIRDLVNLALPGILLHPLPVAPRQLPFRSGCVYFELDRSTEFWKQMHNSGGFAIHVSGEFPSIDMELWAIRE